MSSDQFTNYNEILSKYLSSNIDIHTSQLLSGIYTYHTEILNSFIIKNQNKINEVWLDICSTSFAMLMQNNCLTSATYDGLQHINPLAITHSYSQYLNDLHEIVTDKFNRMFNEIEVTTDAPTIDKVRFIIKLYLDMVKPDNFAHLNPSVVQLIISTAGRNLVDGFQNAIEDIRKTYSIISLHNSKSHYFEVGKNIAITPGKVVYQNELMQLIKYEPATKKVYDIPLLIVPPWINKYYILDLQPHNSFVKWLVDANYTVYLISWVNPDESLSDKRYDDYMLEGPIQAIEIIRKLSNVKQVNALGYCVGGTLLACTLAYLARKNQYPVASATYLTTLLDFSTPGDTGVFIDEYQVALINEYMSNKGYMDGALLAMMFNLLKANDIIWTRYIQRYLSGGDQKAFDILYWNSDSTNLTYRSHSFYLEQFYLKNNLVVPDKVMLDDTPLDLQQIKTPAFFLASQSDHIVVWQASYNSMLVYPGNKEFVLAGSGHVSGVINPPLRNKYSYWVNPKGIFDSPQYWKEAAIEHQGSWWNHWHRWLRKFSGKLLEARDKYDDLPFIENAPGSYVKKTYIESHE